MEGKEMTAKDATIKISLRANSGYSCEMKGKIGLDQWEQINTIIDSGSCIQTLQSELEKAKGLLTDANQLLWDGLKNNNELVPFPTRSKVDEITTFLNEGKK